MFYAESLKNLINNVNLNQKYKNILNPSLFDVLKGQGAALGRQKGQGGFSIFKMRAGCSPL